MVVVVVAHFWRPLTQLSLTSAGQANCKGSKSGITLGGGGGGGTQG